MLPPRQGPKVPKFLRSSSWASCLSSNRCCTADGACVTDQQTLTRELVQIELRQVRFEIERLLDARNVNGAFRWSAMAQLRYEQLSKREQALLGLPRVVFRPSSQDTEGS